METSNMPYVTTTSTRTSKSLMEMLVLTHSTTTERLSLTFLRNHRNTQRLRDSIDLLLSSSSWPSMALSSEETSKSVRRFARHDWWPAKKSHSTAISSWNGVILNMLSGTIQNASFSHLTKLRRRIALLFRCHTDSTNHDSFRVPRIHKISHGWSARHSKHLTISRRTSPTGKLQRLSIPSEQYIHKTTTEKLSMTLLIREVSDSYKMTSNGSTNCVVVFGRFISLENGCRWMIDAS